jgi:hypothetical protein
VAGKYKYMVRGGCKSMTLRKYKYIMPRNYKSIVLCKRKCVMLVNMLTYVLSIAYGQCSGSGGA